MYITAPYTKNNNGIGYDLLDCRERYVNGVGVTGLAGNPKEHTTLQHKYYFYSTLHYNITQCWLRQTKSCNRLIKSQFSYDT